MSEQQWQPDILEGFEQRTIPLPAGELAPGESGPLRAVLVRPARPASPMSTASRASTAGGEGSRRAVLYLHGWNDYFFQRHLAEHWQAQGWDFFALDLRRYGRSWSPDQLFGFTNHLGEYAEEITLALEIIGLDHDQVALMGHSTGGLVASLYAADHPGAIDQLVLNSPWLDLQGAPLVRALGPLLIKGLAQQRPTQVLPLPDPGFYRRALHSSEGGEWEYDLTWKSTPEALIRVGWLRAVLAGHARVAAGLQIECPVLVMCSTRTIFSRSWSSDLRSADIVLDVEQIAARAVRLGRVVTVVRITDGMHDLVLSPEPVRGQVFAELDRWLSGYAPSGEAVAARRE